MRAARLDRSTAGIAVAALALLPLQGLALAQASTDGPLFGWSGSSSLEDVNPASMELPSEATAERPTSLLRVDADEVLTRRATQADERREQDEDPAYEAFAEAWPAQAAATQDVRSPDTTRWALIVGINKHRGTVRDNVGSAQDAHDLRAHLLDLGWRDDHIVLITDYDATRDNITAGMTWLAKKTDANSVAAFHYSGHSKKWYDQDHDGDGEITDEGLWPTDDQFIADSEVATRLGAVRAGKFWINFGACNSAGFNDPGLAREGRLLTFSSREDQKSYEDPSVDNSVWGYYLFQEAMIDGHGDLDGDGTITVQEAFAYAAPRAERRTEGQRYGVQSAQVVDQSGGQFSLEIPPPPPQPEPEPEPEASQEPGLLCPIVCEDDVLS